MSPDVLVTFLSRIQVAVSTSGSVWLRRLVDTWSRAVWLNPQDERYWHHTPSITMIRQLFGERMFPLTLDGLERAMRSLSR